MTLFKFQGINGANLWSAGAYPLADGSVAIIVWLRERSLRVTVERPRPSWTGAGKWSW